MALLNVSTVQDVANPVRMRRWDESADIPAGVSFNEPSPFPHQIYAERHNLGASETYSSNGGRRSADGQGGSMALATAKYEGWWRYNTRSSHASGEPFFRCMSLGGTNNDANCKLEGRLRSDGTIACHDSSVLGSTDTPTVAGTYATSASRNYFVQISCGTAAAGAGSFTVYLFEVILNTCILRDTLTSTTATLINTNNVNIHWGREKNRNSTAVDQMFGLRMNSSTSFQGPSARTVTLQPSGISTDDAQFTVTGAASKSAALRGAGDLYNLERYIERAGAAGATPVSITFDMDDMPSDVPETGITYIGITPWVMCWNTANDFTEPAMMIGLVSGGTTDTITAPGLFVGELVLDIHAHGRGKVYTTDPDTSTAFTRAGLNACKLQLTLTDTGGGDGDGFRANGLFMTVVFMATAGPNSPASGTNDATVGTQAWTNPGNIVSSNNTRAQSGVLDHEEISNYMFATDFGFDTGDFSADATITKVTVEIERHQDTTGSVGIIDSEIKMIVGGAVQASPNMSAGAAWVVGSASEAYATFEFVEDLPTAAEIHGSDFGIAIAVEANDDLTEGNVNGRVDHVRVTITFTEPEEGGPQIGGIVRIMRSKEKRKKNPITITIPGAMR